MCVCVCASPVVLATAQMTSQHISKTWGFIYIKHCEIMKTITSLIQLPSEKPTKLCQTIYSRSIQLISLCQMHWHAEAKRKTKACQKLQYVKATKNSPNNLLSTSEANLKHTVHISLNACTTSHKNSRASRPVWFLWYYISWQWAGVSMVNPAMGECIRW